MQIRNMAITDYETVYNMWFDSPGIGVMSIDDSMNGIRIFLERNPDTCLVAVDGERVIGVIMCGFDGRRAYIYHFIVDKDHRGHNVGTTLIETLITRLEAMHVNKVALVAFSDNEKANEFWKARGFKERPDLNYLDRQINAENIWLNKDVVLKFYSADLSRR
ncbi:MAG: GNAT family N-acetyltransferase [Candidatus Methanomethylophilaceae archaeon]|nr:GNAT family N-acetyltransferase [Candidatus Methanomethylophilaceae archaeon]